MISLDYLFKKEKKGKEALESLRLKDVMTEDPVTVRANHHLITVQRLMTEHNIRHIPIVDKKGVVGIISDRDLNLMRAVYNDTSFEDIRINDTIIQKPCIEDEDCYLKDALNRMIENKYESVLVGSTTRVIGIFTTIDACKVLLQCVE